MNAVPNFIINGVFPVFVLLLLLAVVVQYKKREEKDKLPLLQVGTLMPLQERTPFCKGGPLPRRPYHESHSLQSLHPDAAQFRANSAVVIPLFFLFFFPFLYILEENKLN